MMRIKAGKIEETYKEVEVESIDYDVFNHNRSHSFWELDQSLCPSQEMTEPAMRNEVIEKE
jgi:hypothetical protein